MKKMIGSMMAARVLVVSLLVGCGSSNNAGSIEGSWEVTSATINGQEVSIPGRYMTFYTNGQCTATIQSGEQSTVDYTYENGVLTLGGDHLTANINGDTMTIIRDEYVLTLERVIVADSSSTDEQAPDTLEGTTWEVRDVVSTVTGKEKTDVPGGTMTFQNGQCTQTFADDGTSNVFPYEYADGIAIIDGNEWHPFQVSGNIMTYTEDEYLITLVRK